jgi:hypothetical protein
LHTLSAYGLLRLKLEFEAHFSKIRGEIASDFPLFTSFLQGEDIPRGIPWASQTEGRTPIGGGK